MNPHDPARLACAALLCAVMQSCSSDTDASPASGESEPIGPPMVEVLDEIASNADPQTYLYANTDRAAMMYDRALQADDFSQRLQFLLMSAGELIRAGRTIDAIQRIEQVRTIMRNANRRPSDFVRGATLHLEALAALRLGEQDNCLENHTPASCIMPIAREGVHGNPRGSRRAITALEELLTLQPDSLQYRWLLNLAHMTLGEYPHGVRTEYRIDPTVFESEGDIGFFDDVAAAAGVDVFALSGGAIMEDIDLDGRLDLIMSSWGLRDQLRYFHNTGKGHFEDRTAAAGLTGQVGGLNLSHADYDNDGDVDLFIMRGGWLFGEGEHPNSLLRNNGDGTFTDVTRAAGLFTRTPSQTCTWGDIDHDGDLDLFVGTEPTPTKKHYAQLWRNNGDGTFEDIAARARLNVSGIIKAATFGDYDNDGLLDLYVSRFGDTNQLLHHDGIDENGNVRFVDVTASAGVAEPLNSFPTWFFDYDNDGYLDLLVAGFAGFDGDSLAQVVADYLGAASDGTRCVLYRNNGDGTFEDVAPKLGLDHVLLAMGANFGDVDNDGWLDCAFGTGEPTMTTLVPNRLFRNAGGERFDDITTSSGFGNIQKGHGIAFGDLDHDGDQDIAITMGGAYEGDIYPNRLLRNPGHDHRWITVRCEGTTNNHFGVGARIAITVQRQAGERTIHRVVGTGGSFGSSSLQQEIGLGKATAITSMRVEWPASGTVDVFTDVPLDAVVLVREGAEKVERLTPPAAPLPEPGAAHDHGGHHHGHHGHGHGM